MNMAFCRGCGTEIHESAPLCPKCGATQVTHANSQSNSKGTNWLAISSLVTASLSLLVSVEDTLDKDQVIGTAMVAIIAIVLGVVNFQQQRAGKTMAIIGVVLASISLLICLGRNG